MNLPTISMAIASILIALDKSNEISDAYIYMLYSKKIVNATKFNGEWYISTNSDSIGLDELKIVLRSPCIALFWYTTFQDTIAFEKAFLNVRTHPRRTIFENSSDQQCVFRRLSEIKSQSISLTGVDLSGKYSNRLIGNDSTNNIELNACRINGNFFESRKQKMTISLSEVKLPESFYRNVRELRYLSSLSLSDCIDLDKSYNSRKILEDFPGSSLKIDFFPHEQIPNATLSLSKSIKNLVLNLPPSGDGHIRIATQRCSKIAIINGSISDELFDSISESFLLRELHIGSDFSSKYTLKENTRLKLDSFSINHEMDSVDFAVSLVNRSNIHKVEYYGKGNFFSSLNKFTNKRSITTLKFAVDSDLLFDLSVLTSFVNLTHLDLHAKDRHIMSSNLPILNVKHLHLSNVVFSDKCISIFCKFPFLQTLVVPDAILTLAQIERLLAESSIKTIVFDCSLIGNKQMIDLRRRHPMRNLLNLSQFELVSQ
jgi:hypothetical protein